MKKKQDLRGIGRMIRKYKKLLDEAKVLYNKELLAEESYKKAKRLRKEKEDIANKNMESISILYEIDAKTAVRLLDSPTNSLLSYNKDSNTLFACCIDEWYVPQHKPDSRIKFDARTIKFLHSRDIFYIGDLIQRTSSDFKWHWVDGEEKRHLKEILDVLDNIGLHLGIEIVDWVKLPKPEKKPEETQKLNLSHFM